MENSNYVEMTGYQNQGQLVNLSFLLEVPRELLSVYLLIGKYSLGYCRKDTNVPSDLGVNRNAKAWAEALNMGKSTFLRQISKLEQLNLIKVHKGSQYMLNGGSYPNYYSIVFKTELQIKHHIFFNTSGLPSKRKDKVTKPTEIKPYGLQFTYLDSDRQGNVYRPIGNKGLEVLTNEFVDDCKLRNVDTNIRERELRTKKEMNE